MESQPQNPEFKINPESFHPWDCDIFLSPMFGFLSLKSFLSSLSY